jgi:cell division septal protein FtsQ
MALKLWRYSTSVPMAENNNQKPDRGNTNRRATWVALGVIVVLSVIGWVLTRELYSNSKIEDCVMSGRTNCAPIDMPSSSY